MRAFQFEPSTHGTCEQVCDLFDCFLGPYIDLRLILISLDGRLVELGVPEGEEIGLLGRVVLPGDMVTRMIDGKMERRLHRPSTETIARSMGHLTVAVSVDRIGRISRILCNSDEVSKQCMDIIEGRSG